MHNLFKKVIVLCGIAILSNPAIAQEPIPVQPAEITNVTHRELNRVERISRNSAVKVLRPNGGHGTGTYVQIGKEYVVITAEHVVRNLNYAFVQGSVNEFVPATIIYRHENSDVAILKIPRLKSRKPAKYKPAAQDNLIGGDCLYSGYPSDYDLFTIKGTISGYDPRFNAIIIQSFGWFGASGSGVFDHHGRLIGVISGISVESGPYGPELLETLIHVAPVSAIKLRTIKEALAAS